jgi:hypothetical protein
MRETSDPRIFVEVLRPIGDGKFECSRKQISLIDWESAKFPGTVAEVAINAALADVGYEVS